MLNDSDTIKILHTEVARLLKEKRSDDEIVVISFQKVVKNFTQERCLII